MVSRDYVVAETLVVETEFCCKNMRKLLVAITICTYLCLT
jgi:hypothetical protein